MNCITTTSIIRCILFTLCALLISPSCTPLPVPKNNTVTFFGVNTPKTVVKVEVVQSAAERSRGLMGRKTLAPHHGMLFIFDTMQLHPFWMKQTLVSLDMIFLDNKMNVVGIIHNVPPLNLERRSIDKPSRYVVEVPAGYARANHITIGSKAVFQLANAQHTR